MISDVLFESKKHIERYLTDPAFKGVYQGEIREEINSLLVEMERLRVKLDTPPIEKFGSCGDEPN